MQACAKSSCIMHVNDTVLKSNVAVNGAGINQYAGEAQLVLANVTIHRNSATRDGGGGHSAMVCGPAGAVARWLGRPRRLGGRRGLETRTDDRTDPTDARAWHGLE